MLAFDTAQASPASIHVYSPAEGMIYPSDNVTLKYNAYHPSSGEWKISYSLDEGKSFDASSSENIVLKGLSQGEHKVAIALYQWLPWSLGPPGSYLWSGEKLVVVRFFVNTGIAPSISIEGKSSFIVSNANVVIATDLPDATVFYSLDGQTNVTLPKTQLVQRQNRYQYNLNLTDLTDGTHTIAAYASDVMNNTGVAEKTFTVETGSIEPTIEPTQPPTNTLPPIAFVAGGAIAGVIIASVILLFHRRAKPKQTEIVKI